MITKINHKGLERYFTTGNTSGVKQEHIKKIRLILGKLNTAYDIKDMRYPGSCLHLLKGDKKGFWSVSVSGNWRIIFRFENGEVIDVDYIDYH